MSITLGEHIFLNIESNEYLQELFDAILYNYSLKLFGINQSPIEFNLDHALRFADLLSKSTDSNRAEQHKVWAQEIVALLFDLYPENQKIRFYLGSVLTNTNNFRGLSLHPSVYHPVNLFESVFEEYKKSDLRIPGSPSEYFFQAQKMVYNSLVKDRFSYSGPTSMGKSFVMRIFIKEQIEKGYKQNYAIIVPTKALINEVSSKLILELKGLLYEKDYRVVTAVGAIALEQMHNFILVLTPERLLYLLIDKPDLEINCLFIDEAHKISSKDSRSPFYYKIIDILSNRANPPRFLFSAPNIPNPEVYLQLISDNLLGQNERLSTRFSPVSQIKYVIDLVKNEVLIHNDYSHKNQLLEKLDNDYSLTKVIKRVGENAQNIVYCSSTSKAIEYALEYSNGLTAISSDRDLLSLANDVKNQIHNDYYLAELLKKGIAYHVGYLPSGIRMRIEELFRKGSIKTVFCTSTLVEGINLPADNLFITSYKNGASIMTPIDFRNLVGRVGRIEYNLYGNVFLVRLSETIKIEKYKDLIDKDVPDQKLSIKDQLTTPQKKIIVECLRRGQIELLRYPNNQSNENYSLMRKFALILLKDILDNNHSLVYKAFSSLLSPEAELEIRKSFYDKGTDDDINISIDQTDTLLTKIQNGLGYPQFNSQGFIDYNDLLSFLEELCQAFKWEKYEARTLGFVSKKTGGHGKLRWYAVILSQWIRGNGLNIIMDEAIKYKQKHPNSGVEINNQIVEYDDSIQHRNIVISETLLAIEDVLLFRISNYFLKFSMEYKKYHKLEILSNDWYEYVEYGTTNPLTIFLQRNGFSREASTYIGNHKEEYITLIDEEFKIKAALLQSQNTAVKKEAEEIKYNIPELFV